MNNPFESELEKLARTLTDQFGVQVVCQGDQAWTDGNRIAIPSVPDPMDEGLERMMVGYLDHEMAHVAFSEFHVAEEFEKKHPGYLGLLNVVEDALIERRAMERWSGVRHNLDTMFQQIRGRIAELITKRSPFDRLCTAVYLRLSHHNDMMGMEQEVAGYGDLLDCFPQIHNTCDAANLAESILQRWFKEHTPQRQEQSQPNETAHNDNSRPQQGESASGNATRVQPDSSEPQQQDGHSNESSEANDQRACSSQHRPDDSQGASKDSEAEPQNGRETMPQQSKEDDSQSASGHAAAKDDPDVPQSGCLSSAPGQGGTLIGEALTEAIADCVAKFDGSRQYRPFTKQYDRIEVVQNANNADVQSLMDTGKDTVRRLRRGLTNALRSAEKRWWRDDQTRGELSPRTLHRLCTDRSRLDVFRTRSSVQGKSTAVSIVLDASGSMSSRKMNVARSAMRVLLEALGDLKIATEAFTFTTGNEIDMTLVMQQAGTDATQLRERYGRLSNLEIGVIKRFEEPVKDALQRLPSIKGSGLTPLGEAMNIGVSRLMPRPESRKIMLVLTDGKAGCEGGKDSACAHAEYVARLISKTGIELVGVGIMDDNLCAVVEDTIVIQKLEELPAQLCKLLSRTLRKGLRHVG